MKNTPRLLAIAVTLATGALVYAQVGTASLVTTGPAESKGWTVKEATASLDGHLVDVQLEGDGFGFHLFLPSDRTNCRLTGNTYVIAGERTGSANMHIVGGDNLAASDSPSTTYEDRLANRRGSGSATYSIAGGRVSGSASLRMYSGLSEAAGPRKYWDVRVSFRDVPVR